MTHPSRLIVIALFATALALNTLAGCSVHPAAVGSEELSPCNRMHDIDLPAQNFDTTAQTLGQISNCFIKTDFATTTALQTQAVSGHLSIAAALARTLRGTPLSVLQHGDTLIVD